MILFVFDIDGTLTTNANLSTIAFRASIKDVFGICDYSEKWSEYQHDSDTGIISEIVTLHRQRLASKRELHAFQKHYLSSFEKLLSTGEQDIIPVDGIFDFIGNIKNTENIKIALFTGGFPSVAKRKLDLISIDSRLLISSAFDGLTRENIFLNCVLKASKKYRCTFENIVLFGDSFSDIVISQKNKIPLVGVTTQLSANTFTKAGAIRAIPNYKGINVEEIIKYVSS